MSKRFGLGGSFAVFTVFGGWLGLILTGIKRYDIWGQVLYLYESGATLWALLQVGHVHGPRYALVYPALRLADSIAVEANLVFSLLVWALNIFMFVLLTRTGTMLYGPRYRWFRVLLALFALSLFMNGRMTFGLLGGGILLYAFASDAVARVSVARLLGFVFLGLWLMSVSTGAFVVGFGAVVSYVLLRYAHRLVCGRGMPDVKLMAIGFALIVFSGAVAAAINKNLSYYDGSFLLMLTHGLGALALHPLFLVTVILVIPLLLLVSVYLLLLSRSDVPVRVCLPLLASSLVVGIFGYSSLVCGLPAVFLLAQRVRVRCWGVTRRSPVETMIKEGA